MSEALTVGEDENFELRRAFINSISILKKDVEKYRSISCRTDWCQRQLRENVMKSIQNIMLDMIENISNDKSPTFFVRNQRTWANCEFDKLLRLKREPELRMVEVNHGRWRSCREFSLIVHLLAKIYRLLANNATSTKREVYYEDPVLYESQRNLESVLDRICCYLDVPPWCLGLLATSKGLVLGPLRITSASGEVIDCLANGGVLVPPDLPRGSRLATEDALFVLIVEKDAVFQKLVDEEFVLHHGPCIIVTGKGFPDLNTRVLVKMLHDQLGLPILILVDADPYGIEIMAVYRFGSLKQCHMGEVLAVPGIKWLGIHPTDIDQFLTRSEPLSELDVRKARHLLARPYVRQNDQLLHQINYLLDQEKKTEIETLTRISPGYLTQVYIPMKITANQLI